MSTRLGVMRWLVIAGRKGIPCPHTTIGLIRPWLSSCPRSSSNDVEAPSHRDQPATAALLLGSGSAIAICCPSSGSSCCAFPRRGRSVRVVTRYGKTVECMQKCFRCFNLRIQTCVFRQKRKRVCETLHAVSNLLFRRQMRHDCLV